MANLTEEEEETSFLNVDLDVFARVSLELTLDLCALVRRLPKGHRRLWDTVALVAGLGGAMLTTYAPPVTRESRP
jgi:hypothetical protein